MSDNPRMPVLRLKERLHGEFLFSYGRAVEGGLAPAFAGSFGGQPSPLEGWLANRSRGAAKVGGARRNRTDDLLLAKQALSQLSYGP